MSLLEDSEGSFHLKNLSLQPATNEEEGTRHSLDIICCCWSFVVIQFSAIQTHITYYQIVVFLLLSIKTPNFTKLLSNFFWSLLLILVWQHVVFSFGCLWICRKWTIAMMKLCNREFWCFTRSVSWVWLLAWIQLNLSLCDYSFKTLLSCVCFAGAFSFSVSSIWHAYFLALNLLFLGDTNRMIAEVQDKYNQSIYYCYS